MLADAVAAARELRDALAAEVEQAREERNLLKRMDARRLFERASRRVTFNAEVMGLEQRLAAALSQAGRQLGLGEVTLAALERRLPAEAGLLSRVFGEIRALGSALRELDQLNLFLVGRALSCVRGYVNALSPTPSAYDRRGARATLTTVAVVSSKG
jgi:hypothetical protein